MFQPFNSLHVWLGQFLKYPGQYFVVFIDSRVNVFIEGQGFYFAVRMWLAFKPHYHCASASEREITLDSLDLR